MEEDWEKPIEKLKLDSKDKKVINYVIEHGRASLTEIAKKTGVKIDSIRRRLRKLEQEGLIAFWKAVVWYKALGYPIAAYVSIKLRGYSSKEYEDLISYLCSMRTVTDVVSVSGNYDILIYIVAKNRLDLDKVTQHIRQKFKDIISDWSSVTVVRSYKFDKFSLD